MQIRSLCDLPQDVCAAAILSLEQAGFLWRAPDGRFVRRALGRAGREISEPCEPYVDRVRGPFALVDQTSD